MRADFNPGAAAQAEYEFWRAHNDNDEPRLRAALETWTSELYGVDAESAAEAVEYFLEAVQQNHDQREWSLAVENAGKYYEVVVAKAGLSFDSKRAGELEVTWWQIHDELEFETDKIRLVNAFADLYRELFGLTPEQSQEIATARVQATIGHDRAEADGVAEDEAEKHWQAARAELEKSYIALLSATEVSHAS